MSSEGEKTIDLSKIITQKLPDVSEGPTIRLSDREKPYIKEDLPGPPSRIEFTNINNLFEVALNAASQGSNGVLEFSGMDSLIITNRIALKPQCRLIIMNKQGEAPQCAFQMVATKVDASRNQLRFGINETQNLLLRTQDANIDIKIPEKQEGRFTHLMSAKLEYASSESYLFVRPYFFDDEPSQDQGFIKKEREEREEIFDLMTNVSPFGSEVLKQVMGSTNIRKSNEKDITETLIKKVDFLRKRLPSQDTVTINSQRILLLDPNSFGRIASRWAQVTTAVVDGLALTHGFNDLMAFRKMDNKVRLHWQAATFKLEK